MTCGTNAHTLSLQVAMIEFSIKNKYLGHTNSIYALAKYDAQYFLSAGGDGKLVKWDINDDKNAVLLATVEAQIFSLLYDAEVQIAYLGLMNGHLIVLDLANKKKIQELKFGSKPIYSLEFVEESLYIATGEGILFSLNKKSLELQGQCQISNQAVRCSTRDKGVMLLGCSDGHIYIYSISENKVLDHFFAHENSVFTLLLNGDEVISGGRDALIKVWDKSNLFTQKENIVAHTQTVNQLLVHHNLLISASRDKSIKAWDMDSKRLLKVLNRSKMDFHTHSVNRILSFNDEILISAGDDRSIFSFEISEDC